VPDFDSPVVERLRAAGAISLGKTTMPECGWKGCGDSPLTGISHNPWRHGFNAGGSSTGAAICAAAGIGPLHQGTDGAGSIRMPAAFCGVYGFKPSFGRIAYHPLPNTDLISTLGPLSRTVTDAALFLAATAGADDRDPWSIAGPIPDFLGALEGGIEGWRIAFSPDLAHLRVDPEIAAIVRAALPAFEEAGARVEEVDPGFGDTLPVERVLFPANLAGTLAPVFEQVRERMDPGLVAMIEHGRDFGVVDYLVAQSARAELYQRMVALFSRYVLLVTPSLSVAAFPAGRLIPEHWEQHPWDWLRWAGFSYPFNLTWMPAASVPCGFTADGLPVGLQIAAGRHGDLAVLRASRAFEQARPWADHRPPL
jgi:aspartyl-tRNA(Asn)/glutamyl-tRNA(Gln) amidotransferase subunit A